MGLLFPESPVTATFRFLLMGKNVGYNGLLFVGVALLPFVDERRLRAALAEVYPDLTSEESK